MNKCQAVSRTSNAAALALALTLSIAALGCPPEPPQTTMDDLFPPGQLSVTTRDAIIAASQPVDPGRLSPEDAFKGQPGRAIPAGTLLQRVPNTDPRASQTHAAGKINLDTHAWVAFEVTASVHASQIGWFGWVHSGDLTPPTPGFEPSDATSKIGMAPDRLNNAAWLCPFPNSGSKCEVEVHPSLPIRLLDCSGDYARISLWDLEGIFVSGFVRRDMFKADPCP